MYFQRYVTIHTKILTNVYNMCKIVFVFHKHEQLIVRLLILVIYSLLTIYNHMKISEHSPNAILHDMGELIISQLFILHTVHFNIKLCVVIFKEFSRN